MSTGQSLKHNQGFSLMEMAVVLAVTAAMTVAVVPSVIQHAQYDVADNHVDTVLTMHHALKTYYEVQLNDANVQNNANLFPSSCDALAEAGVIAQLPVNTWGGTFSCEMEHIVGNSGTDENHQVAKLTVTDVPEDMAEYLTAQLPLTSCVDSTCTSTILPPNAAVVFGCMDESNCNYNPVATESDESQCLTEDCAGVCGGTASNQGCGCGEAPVDSQTNCCASETAINWYPDSDCDDLGDPGEAPTPHCGEPGDAGCWADNNDDAEPNCATNNTDCAGVCAGAAELDECGTCDDDNSNDCTQDCNQDWGGTAYIDNCETCVGGSTGESACEQDECGEWGGDDSTCLDECGVPNGDDTSCADECGVPNGDDTSCADECGIPNGDNTTCADDCGVANGDNTTCADCNGDPNGFAMPDMCDVCAGGQSGQDACEQDECGEWGGDSSTCEDDCGVPNGNNSCVDDCGVPNGNNSCVDDCGVPNGSNSCVDDCGVANGDNSCMDDCGVAYGNNSCVDDCGVAYGNNSCVDDCGVAYGNNSTCVDDCGVPNGNNSCVDDCGVAYGNNSTCVDDCGVPNGNNSCVDDCGVPNGNNSTCVDDCGVPNGNNSCVDECGVLNGDGTTCDDCNGEPNGGAYEDACGECVGGGTGEQACQQDVCGDWGGEAQSCDECGGPAERAACYGCGAEYACCTDDTHPGNIGCWGGSYNIPNGNFCDDIAWQVDAYGSCAPIALETVSEPAASR